MELMVTLTVAVAGARTIVQQARPLPWTVIVLDRETFAQTVVTASFGGAAFNFLLDARLLVSSDPNRLYWATDVLGRASSSSFVYAINLDTGQTVDFATAPAFPLAVTRDAPCTFVVPDHLDAPAEGGVVDIAVSALGPCPAWTGAVTGTAGPARILNPTPSVGSGTLQVLVSPSSHRRLTTASRCATSTTAISSSQLSSPVMFQAFRHSGMSSIKRFIEPKSTRPTRTKAWIP